MVNFKAALCINIKIIPAFGDVIKPPFDVFLKMADAIQAEVLYSEIDGQIEIHHVIPKRKTLN